MATKRSIAYRDFCWTVQGWAFTSKDKLPVYIERGSCAAEKITNPKEQQLVAETLQAMKEALSSTETYTILYRSYSGHHIGSTCFKDFESFEEACAWGEKEFNSEDNFDCFLRLPNGRVMAFTKMFGLV